MITLDSDIPALGDYRLGYASSLVFPIHRSAHSTVTLQKKTLTLFRSVCTVKTNPSAMDEGVLDLIDTLDTDT